MAHQLAGNPHIAVQDLEFDLSVEIFTDGTTTQAYLVAPDDGVNTYQATGVARRRKGDPRNFEVGRTLAVSRALRELADRFEEDAERLSR